MVWYRAGSMDEKDGTTGVAHVLEHMMFKGTKKLKPGEFNKRVAAAGGRDNAFTSRDYTAYFQQVPGGLPEMMELEADRMANLVLDDEGVRAGDQGGHGRAAPAHRRQSAGAGARTADGGRLPGAPLPPAHHRLDERPREHDGGGCPRLVPPLVRAEQRLRGRGRRRRTRTRCSAWPRSITARFPRRALPERKPQTEPEQAGKRRVTVKAPAKLPYLSMAWKAPASCATCTRIASPMRWKCSPPCSTATRRALLARNLVRGARSPSAGAGYDATCAARPLFTSGGTPAEGKSRGRTRSGLRAEIARVAEDEGVSAEELERESRRSHRRPDLQARFDDGAGHGNRRLEASRRELARHRYPAGKARSVTAEEVQAVAKKYFPTTP
jgi:zinc protease